MSLPWKSGGSRWNHHFDDKKIPKKTFQTWMMMPTSTYKQWWNSYKPSFLQNGGRLDFQGRCLATFLPSSHPPPLALQHRNVACKDGTASTRRNGSGPQERGDPQKFRRDESSRPQGGVLMSRVPRKWGRINGEDGSKWVISPASKWGIPWD